MNKAMVLSLLAAAISGVVAALVCLVRVLLRRREIRRAEKEDRIVFHDEVDSKSPLFDGLRVFVLVMLFFTFPVAIAGIVMRSHAGTLCNLVAVVAIVPSYIMFARRLYEFFEE